MEERTNFMGGKIDIQIKHRNKVLTLRRLDRLIQSDDFTFIWCRISHEEKKAASFLIWLEEYDHFKNWMSKQLDLKFKMYSIRDLRALASKYHIGYYSRKTRAELIKALTDKGVLDGNTNGPFNQDETVPSCCGCKKVPSEPVNQKAALKIGSGSL